MEVQIELEVVAVSAHLVARDADACIHATEVDASTLAELLYQQNNITWEGKID